MNLTDLLAIITMVVGCIILGMTRAPFDIALGLALIGVGFRHIGQHLKELKENSDGE